jgi:carbamoylphosphate synthase large subunit
MAKLLILGAGIYQVPLIQKSKELGHYVIVVSINGNYPGFKYADKVYYVDTTDKESVLKISISENIDGILTTGTDVAVNTIGYVCDKMLLTGISEKTAQISTDKALMKLAFSSSIVRTAKFFKCRTLDDAKEKYYELNETVILKSVDSSGSRGIIKIKNFDELEYGIGIVKSATKKDYFIIEEFITGVEFGAQALIVDGQIKFIMPHGDYLFHGDTGVPIGHYVPFQFDKSLQEDIFTQVKYCIDAMHIKTAALNLDFILRDGVVYVLEVGARAGATGLVEMVSVFYNFDYYKTLIDLSLGKDINFKVHETTACCNMLLMADKSGVIKKQEAPKMIDSNIVSCNFDYNLGDYVKKFNVGPDRIGEVFAKGATLDEAKKSLDDFLSQVKIIIED